MEKKAIGSHFPCDNSDKVPPIATSEASTHGLNGAPGIGCLKKVASAIAFLAARKARSAFSFHLSYSNDLQTMERDFFLLECPSKNCTMGASICAALGMKHL
ncbi:hypothetical protein AVEN_120934-1 [Araneus ventricosus]|uniref:Uncharacterized protein n=1 Tax=Araneus ventricosus TaxID=182803 RepID=A0A4Y2NLZ2_ARAVE|nr:hypothetical protein AVEN_120934-1 [Araneus ventricosus]